MLTVRQSNLINTQWLPALQPTVPCCCGKCLSIALFSLLVLMTSFIRQVENLTKEVLR